jgi:hypothetical protein
MSRHLMQKLSQEAFLTDVSSPEELVDLITLEELGRELNIHKQKASMLAHWALGCYKVGSRVLVSRNKLEVFLEPLLTSITFR